MKQIKNSQPHRRDANQPPSKKPLILYVEDEDPNWDVTQLQLRDRYELIRASSAEEACEKVRSQGPNLYAVLMDIQLHNSKMNGIELTLLFKGRQPDTARLPSFAHGCDSLKAPIIFVTAYAERYEKKELLAVGGDAVLTKPVDFVRLSLALASYSSSRVMSLLTPNTSERPQ